MPMRSVCKTLGLSYTKGSQEASKIDKGCTPWNFKVETMEKCSCETCLFYT